jgi:hypothetical protein
MAADPHGDHSEDIEDVPDGSPAESTRSRIMSTNEFQLRFRSLFDAGRGYAFPCDGNGRVDLDQLSERARNNYFYARAMVGRELAVPDVERTLLH